MKAMIFAAGYGTRLKPLTDNKPKALVNVCGVPMLEILIHKLIRFGFNQLVINVHHFADQIVEFLEKNNNFGVQIQISDEREFLLDTGGGLKKAAPFLQGSESFLVHNVDILTDLDLNELVKFHQSSNAIATLAVKNRNTSRNFLFDEQLTLKGWKNNSTNQVKWVSNPMENYKEIAFSGIHVIKPEMLDLITENGAFSVVDLYLRLAGSNKINAFDHSASQWYDLGTADKIKSIKNIQFSE